MELMMEKIDHPMAEIAVRWIPAADGGRRSGPPTAPVYMATCIFVESGDDEMVPGWPSSADQLSILLQPTRVMSEYETICLAGFLAPDLAADHLRIGSELLVMEGPKPVAHARVTRLLMQS